MIISMLNSSCEPSGIGRQTSKTRFRGGSYIRIPYLCSPKIKF